jgi:signal transduction histidine kinase
VTEPGELDDISNMVTAGSFDLAKNQLLSRISHELRTPLHAILGFAELLDGPGRPAHERAAVQQIMASGRRLQALADELLAWAGGHRPAEGVAEGVAGAARRFTTPDAAQVPIE